MGNKTEIDCPEFELNDDEALQLILIAAQTERCVERLYSDRIGLQQVTYFQSKALANLLKNITRIIGYFSDL
jgi:hypothetical protein